MAKEMMIIFVYDMELVQREEDDPAMAILYFHPGWVSDQQKTALCGQIVGTCHFLRSTFSSPRIFALQSGKFAIRFYGRYILAVGTDRNIPDWVLNYRTNTLSSLISFFHNDIRNMAELYPETGKLPAKLYHMFETYLKILMYGGHMFYNTPMVQIAKGSSYVFLDAMHLLQSCQQEYSVLGGTILYHNKVVATQLSSELTKILVLTDPYRIKSPAEIAPADFNLPLGVQILVVYIDENEYNSLSDDAKKRKSFSDYFKKKTTTKKCKPRETGIKRDQSLIFTTVPEEGNDSQPPDISDKPPNRPNFLNLKTKASEFTLEEKIETTSKKSVPSTPYQGQTSVCSTPLTELRRFVHKDVKPLCLDPKELEAKMNQVQKSQEKAKEFDTTSNVAVNGSIYDKKLNASMWDVREKLQSFSKRVTMKYYNIAPTNIIKNLEMKEDKNGTKRNSLADPLYPFRRSNGLSISSVMYNDFIIEHVNNLNQQLLENTNEKKVEIETKEEQVKVKDTKKGFNFPFLNIKRTKAKPDNKERRKSLNLPLKSLTMDTDSKGGELLTPLMSKLSSTGWEEKSSGFCSKDATPCDFRSFTPSVTFRSFVPNQSNEEEKNKKERVKATLCPAYLFVCGQQDMVITLLLENVTVDEAVISKLWDLCTETLGTLEKQLRRCLELVPDAVHNETGEIYSYLCMDTVWDSCKRGGLWGGSDLGILTHLQRDFNNFPNIMEIILRNEDNVVYGNRLGTTEIFYQEPAACIAGVPPPSDPMGMVALKAKRNLERDHSIILL